MLQLVGPGLNSFHLGPVLQAQCFHLAGTVYREHFTEAGESDHLCRTVRPLSIHLSIREIQLQCCLLINSPN